MSRSGYIDDCDDQWGLIRWRGAVNSAISGKRGQAFLRELAEALDAMPVKELTRGELVTQDGACCALGAVAMKRGMPVVGIDPEDYFAVADAFGIARAMAQEIMFENDDDFARLRRDNGTEDADCWKRMREWVARNTKQADQMAA